MACVGFVLRERHDLASAPEARAANVAARTSERRELSGRARAVRRELAVALLRGAAGLALQEIADTLAVSYGCVHASRGRHEARLKARGGYEEFVAGALQGAVRRPLGLSILPVVGDGAARRVVRI
jgi:hypothetical protein